jgi:arylsulfate sulfotransferase
MSLKSIQSFVVCLICFCAFFGCNESKFDYTISAELNPHRIAPLTAMLQIISEAPARATIKVLGESPIEQSFETLSDSLSIPVVGLYPDKVNKVLVTLIYEGGTVTDTVDIKTKPLYAGFPSIEINKLERNNMENGMHACDFHLANYGKFNSMPIIFDDQGIVRWFLDLSFANEMMSPFQRLSDGTILVVNRHKIFEFDMLGNILKQTEIDNNYGMHHDVLELPDGNLLICVGKKDAYIEVDGETIQSDSDFIILFDRKNSKILKEWDLAKHMDVSRDDVNFLRKGDWLHMNALAYDENDQSIVVSGKNQGLVKITMEDELRWIMAPKMNWTKSGRNGQGKDTKPFLLTAVNSEDIPYSNAIQNGNKSHFEFDFPWGQHAPKILPNGNLIVFDNGSHRNYNDENNYSRAVEYSINDDKKTVRQVWQYGKERGEDMFSAIISDVDYLPKTENILVTSGHISPQNNHSGKIIEVDRATGKEVFEATLYYKSVKGEKINGWGQMDILYRSQRMELKY